MFNISHIAKAVGGLAAGFIGAPIAAGAALSIVPGAELTMTGYIVVGALQGAINFASVYFAPANR